VAICDGLSSGQQFLAGSDFDESDLVEINRDIYTDELL
jgi:hypothetical protein